MEEKLIKLAQKRCEEDTEITMDSSIMDDLEFTSMELFSFISEVEAAFQVKISEREMQRIDTLSDVAELIEKKQGE